MVSMWFSKRTPEYFCHTHLQARGMDFERQLLKNMCITPAFLCANIMCGLQHYIVTLRNRLIYILWWNHGLHDCKNTVQPNYRSLSSFFTRPCYVFLRIAGVWGIKSWTVFYNSSYRMSMFGFTLVIRYPQNIYIGSLCHRDAQRSPCPLTTVIK